MANKNAAESKDTREVSLTSGERLVAYAIRERKGTVSSWVRIGSAWVNRDGSLNLYLDALPVDGKVHIRRPPVTDDASKSDTQPPAAAN
ncbi:MAG: hypothetical protein INH37_00460 [Myxococcaceae bacterium]|nr:hypothetical protein [Myxococcaceae bacterium]